MMQQAHTSESLQRAFHYLYPDELPTLKQMVRKLETRYPDRELRDWQS